MAKKISFIGTSRGDRIPEINRLLQSLPINNQQVQLIFIDQSNDEKINEIFSQYTDLINYKLIKSQPCSLSKARNIALSYADGNIIGFCDDDAFYSKKAIEYLLNLAIEDALVSFPVVDFLSNKNYAGRDFPTYKRKLSYLSIIRYSLSVGTFIFLKNGSDPNSICFDERLGAGTALGGSEETELFFRLISQGHTAQFDPNICVFHDNDLQLKDNTALAKKYEQYAVGYAVVIKSYLFKSKLLLSIEVARVLSRCIAGLLVPSKRLICFYRFRGFAKGLLTTSLEKTG